MSDTLTITLRRSSGRWVAEIERPSIIIEGKHLDDAVKKAQREYVKALKADRHFEGTTSEVERALRQNEPRTKFRDDNGKTVITATWSLEPPPLYVQKEIP